MQERCKARIEKKLKDFKTSYDFDKTPLAKVASFFEERISENVVSTPREIAGKIDPAATISGDRQARAAGRVLEKLVAPMGPHA